MVNNPKRPNPEQEKLIRQAGLDPDKWSVLKENDLYLYLVDKGIERRECIMIDEVTGKVVASKMP